MPKKQIYLDNVLNKYNSYSYRWAIHMVHPAEASRFQDNIPDRVVTLAESGVEAEIVINSISQTMSTSFSNGERSAFANQFDISLVEPSGATLYNRIRVAADRLRIENHLQAKYLLQLDFVGRRDDDSAEENIVGPFYYSCTMINNIASIRDGASNYSIKMIETNQEAFQVIHLHRPQDINIEARNYGEFLELYEEAINEQEGKKIENTTHQFLPDIFKIKLDDDVAHWADWKFSPIEGESLESTRGISVTSEGKLRFSLSQGTSIIAAMTMVLYHTTEFQKIPIFNQKNQSAKNQPSDINLRPESLQELLSWHKINTNVEFKAYDHQANHYQKELTYIIGQYATPELIHDPFSYNNLFKVKNQKGRLKKLFDNGLIRKRLDYSYTGLNTEVISTEITLNNTYYALQAINYGTLDSSGISFVGASNNNLLAAKLSNELAELNKKISGLENEKNDLIKNNVNPQESGATILAINDIDVQLNNATPLAANKKIDADNARNDFLNENAKIDRSSNQISRYITQDEVSNFGNLNDPSNEKLVSFYSTHIKSKATSGPDQGYNLGTIFLGGVEQNLNTIGDLITQEISIRGDPYWLGRPRGSANEDNAANYERGGVSYFFNANFTTYPSEDTGLMNPNFKETGIVGIYRVVEVKAEYNDGMFTMSLSSFLDTNTVAGLLREELSTGLVELENPTLSPHM